MFRSFCSRNIFSNPTERMLPVLMIKVITIVGMTHGILICLIILSRPAHAEGIGERLCPVSLDLSGWHIAVVRPNIPVSTAEAFSLVTPKMPSECCYDIVNQPVETWRDRLTNDFEKSVFSLYPEIGRIKERLYEKGATYAAMSGSGSSVFGLFRSQVDIAEEFAGMFTYRIKL